MLGKIVYAGTTGESHQHGSNALRELAGLDVSAKQVERVCTRIGNERVAEREGEVSAFQALPLTARKAAPEGVTAPDLAVVSCDGGRLQILDRRGRVVDAEKADAEKADAEKADAEKADAEKADAEKAEAEEGHSGQHWREDKIGLLMSMQSEASASDPCPEIPETFVDPTRIAKLARELKTKRSARHEAAKEASEPEGDLEGLASGTNAGTNAKAKWTPPEVIEKRMVGSRVRWPMFGPILAQAAWSFGFYAAPRKAFVADGSENNWTIWRSHFSSFEPILDFIHALSYVFAAAMADRRFAEGWKIYEEWIGWTWKGEVAKVIEALAARQAELGEPQTEDGETHPRRVVQRSLTYLRNHQSRMKYAEYRRQGLPITSSYVESAVKQFNRRVKGTEKFWSEDGAEAMLQLRADHQSDHVPLELFWRNREAKQTGQRPYHMAA